MKQRKPRAKKCAVCREKFQPSRMMQPTCSVKCAIEKTRLDKQKRQRKEDAETRKRLKPRSKWLSETQSIFNRYIRLRDDVFPCISCGSFTAGQYHASHLFSRGARPDLSFNEDNVHKSCAQCNTFLSGNISEFRKALVQKIGQERVDALEVVGKSDWSTEEIQEIKKEYQRKIREFKEAEDMYSDISDPPF